MAQNHPTQPAVIHTAPGASLSIEDVPVPVAGPGSAVVQILATPVLSYMGDVLSGKRPYPMSYPLTPGTSAIGRVTAVGPDATLLAPGQLVMADMFVTARDNPKARFLMGLHSGSPASKPLMDGEWRHCTWAEHAKFPLENLFPLNEDLLLKKQGYSVQDLCTLLMALVPFGGLDEIGLRAGEAVVIAPATGHFGGAAVGVAISMGASVIAMGRNKDTLQRLSNTYQSTNRLTTVSISESLEENISALTSAAPTGFSAYLDLSPPAAAGNTYLKAAISLLTQDGRVALMGGYAGEVSIPAGLAVHKNLKLFGKWMYTREQVVRCVQMAEVGILGLGARAGIKTMAGYVLDEVRSAIEKAAEESSWGTQVVLEPGKRLL